MKPLLLILALSTLAATAACGNKTETPAEAAAQAPAAVAEALPAEAAAAPAAPAGVNGTPVDTCALLEGSAAAESVGTLVKPPEAQAAQGSLLGGCNYLGDRGILMLTARPAAEYQATVDYAAKKGGGRELGDLPGKASLTPVGLMLQPSGQPYFLVLYPLVGGKFDEAAAQQLARQLKL